MRRDKFCATVHTGRNLSVLTRAKTWFKRSGIDIIRYYYCTENKTRSASSVSKSSLHNCYICATPLYKMDVAEFDESFSSDMVSIYQKKYLIFEDKMGQQYRTCYGLSRCFRRVGTSVEPSTEVDFEVVPPTLAELLQVDIHEEAGEDPILNMAADEILTSYNKHVLPFFQKWMYMPVNKGNALEFMKDLSGIEPHFRFYEDERAIRMVRNKILKVVGVYHG